MPWLFLLIITKSLKPINRLGAHILLFHANIWTNLPGTLCFSQGKVLTYVASSYRLRKDMYLQADDCWFLRHQSARGPIQPGTSTRSFLTATTLIYAFELELPRLLAPDLPSNWSSIKVCKLSSFTLPTLKSIISVTTSLCPGIG